MKRVRTMKQAIKSFRLIFNEGTVINGDYNRALAAWEDSPLAERFVWRNYVFYWYENGAGRVIVEVCKTVEFDNETDEYFFTWLTFDHIVEFEEWFVRCLTKADRNWLSPWRKLGTIRDIFLRYGRVVKEGRLVVK